VRVAKKKTVRGTVGYYLLPEEYLRCECRKRLSCPPAVRQGTQFREGNPPIIILAQEVPSREALAPEMPKNRRVLGSHDARLTSHSQMTRTFHPNPRRRRVVRASRT
jgi:hypothetical protein